MWRSGTLRCAFFYFSSKQTHSNTSTMKSEKCLKCGSTTEEGFIIERRFPIRWIAGKPDWSLLGIKIFGRRCATSNATVAVPAAFSNCM